MKRGFLLLLAAVLTSCGKSKSDSTVYDIRLRTIDNKIIKLSDYKGKVIIVDFWATWCTPCRKSIPDFNRLKERFGDSLMIIGVSKDESPEDVKAFEREIPINYPVVMSKRKIEDRFGGILGLPTAFLIDREGRVVKKFVGYVPYKVWEENVKSLLKP